MAAVGVLAVIVLMVSLARTPAPAAAGNPEATEPPPRAIAETPSPTTTAAAPDREAVYIGLSSGNEVTVALAVSGAEAAAYICDGERVESWLEGTVSGDEVDLEGRNDARLTATLTDDTALGFVTVEGQERPFSAAGARPPAGIYEGQATVDGEPNRIGWIVLPSGRQVGVNNVAGTREPAPELDTSDIDGLEIEGVNVDVRRIVGRDPVVPR